MNHFQPFSALILNGLKAQHRQIKSQPEKIRYSQVTVYECDACGIQHDDESEAATCCETGSEDGTSCPVCGEFWSDYRPAADCCMWKCLDSPKRWAIADAVEAGATWQEAIEAETGQSIN